ncbi:hypothetical protein AHMF7605_26825 [Adhaeribacter arboris]|uniref:Uncharacterized protein n=1 Tax=Adhaeribacter arboris TaxID=2072846 RepID=A0A2T2YMX7_9BACT|nr:hypothetical protein AHMF7605_26825 [Adhaeribacter arboris]
MNEKVKVNSFGKKDKFLRITGTTIQFKNKQIQREEITEIIYDVHIIVFYRFSVGRRYYIGLRTPTQQLDLVFKSFFGLSLDYFTELCNRITEEIWEKTTDKIWAENKKLLLAGKAVHVGNCQISKKGMVLTKQQKHIGWENLHYEVLHDRLVINHSADSSIWTNLYFENTWNIDILIALLDWITKDNGLAEMP